MTTLYVGTSGFAYPEWRPSFYPDGLSAKKMLSFYAARFSSVELNHTFYKLPTREALAASVTQVPPAFRFSVKVPMAISHRKEPSPELLALFAERLAGLGRQAGTVYWQLPPTAKLDLARLQAIVQQLPRWPARLRGGKRVALAFELPDPSWHVEPVRALLQKRGIGFVVVDALDKRGAPVPSQPWRTAPTAYVRLRRDDYDDRALRGWVKRIRATGADEAYVYFKHEAGGRGPRFAQRFLELWNP